MCWNYIILYLIEEWNKTYDCTSILHLWFFLRFLLHNNLKFCDKFFPSSSWWRGVALGWGLAWSWGCHLKTLLRTTLTLPCQIPNSKSYNTLSLFIHGFGICRLEKNSTGLLDHLKGLLLILYIFIVILN
jgi:hypothetical protein